ncbi:MAG: hypothetical protein HRU28_10275 [Rhizobiales bacterium]|nr:hypothetical protein [Hyphomicrobiales bacterium]
MGALSLIAVNYATMCNQAYSITAISRDDFFKAIDAGLVRENITKSEINCKAENFKSIRLEPLGLILHYGHSGFSNQASFRVINAKDTIFSKKLKEHIGSYMLNNQTTNTPKTAKLCLLLATILGVSFISAVVLL